MRLFIALPVADDVRAALLSEVASLRDELADLRWTRPEGWHVTLAFLGRVDGHRVDEVAHAVTPAVAGHGPVHLSLGGVGRFGRRVLWCGVEDDPTGVVARMGERVQAAVDQAGLPVDRRPVHPHLTLARAGKAVIDEQVVARLRVPQRSWVADRVVVYESVLGRGPARYTSVAEVALVG